MYSTLYMNKLISCIYVYVLLYLEINASIGGERSEPIAIIQTCSIHV